MDDEPFPFPPHRCDGGTGGDELPDGFFDGLHEGLNPPGPGIREDRLVGVALGLDPDGGPDDVLHGRPGDPALDPVGGHLLGGDLPDLLVVRDEVGLRDTLPKGLHHPVPEVPDRRELSLLRGDMGLHELGDAEEEVLLREVREAVLEGVLDVPALVECGSGRGRRSPAPSRRPAPRARARAGASRGSPPQGPLPGQPISRPVPVRRWLIWVIAAGLRVNPVQLPPFSDTWLAILPRKSTLQAARCQKGGQGPVCNPVCHNGKKEIILLYRLLSLLSGGV
jgi:hypothetical protein